MMNLKTTVAAALLMVGASGAWAAEETYFQNFNGLTQGGYGGFNLLPVYHGSLITTGSWKEIQSVTVVADGIANDFLSLGANVGGSHDGMTFSFTLAALPAGASYNVDLSFLIRSIDVFSMGQRATATLTTSLPGALPSLPTLGNPFATYATSFTGVSGGSYFITLEHATGTLQTVDFDDFSVAVSTVTAVPEPQTHALMLVGLGVVGATAFMRKGRTNA